MIVTDLKPGVLYRTSAREVFVEKRFGNLIFIEKNKILMCVGFAEREIIPGYIFLYETQKIKRQLRHREPYEKQSILLEPL